MRAERLPNTRPRPTSQLPLISVCDLARPRPAFACRIIETRATVEGFIAELHELHLCCPPRRKRHAGGMRWWLPNPKHPPANQLPSVNFLSDNPDHL
jgi:hypothetical protein